MTRTGTHIDEDDRSVVSTDFRTKGRVRDEFGAHVHECVLVS